MQDLLKLMVNVNYVQFPIVPNVTHKIHANYVLNVIYINIF